MTAVANPPNFPPISRSAWGSTSIDGNESMNPDEVRGMFAPRKPLSRTNSSGSVSSAASNSSASTVLTNGTHSNGTTVSSASDLSQWSGNAAARKRPRNQPWPTKEAQPDYSRLPASGRQNGIPAQHAALPPGTQVQIAAQGSMARPMSSEQLSAGQPVLYLLSLNGTFERKTIAVPFAPESLRIGRQTNQKTVPTATNGFFDSKVLSRQHAEVFAERNGKIFIRDVKSSNGTFVNGTRLSQENRESEPHELSTGDHLELGIDIVSEDQKTVVHHKVAAKVEHAGFMSSSSNVLDMNFGDLDPANSAMMAPGGAVQARGRNGSQAPVAAANNRMMVNPGMNPQANMGAQQRPFFLSPIATDQILKRLSNEMRNARLQAQDLGRTNQFVNTLLSKSDVKDLEKPDAPETKAHLNGGLPFRPDPKTRFSEPPAPPPQQPLPEKPSVPGLKRGPTERPKSGPPEATSPIRQENMSQITRLTEALNTARQDMDSQTARMRELETMLQQEREARELAENLAKRLEQASAGQPNGTAVTAAEKPSDAAEPMEDVVHSADLDTSDATMTDAEPVVSVDQASSLQSRIDAMDGQMQALQEQVEQWKRRCEAAESERDADRKTLAEMVVQLRAEEAQRVAAQKERRSRSRRRRAESTKDTTEEDPAPPTALGQPAVPQSDGSGSSDDTVEEPTLSRANTITPMNPGRGTAIGGQRQLQSGLPYASALGVVLVGMGLMAYINGWQAPPPSPMER